MSHHGPSPFEREDGPDFQKRANLMRQLLNTTGFRGAVGSHPDGVLRKGDDGLIQFAVGDEEGKVVIDFGTPVAWLGMTPKLVARRNGETVTLTIGG
jgi:hypothetical protein